MPLNAAMFRTKELAMSIHKDTLLDYLSRGYDIDTSYLRKCTDVIGYEWELSVLGVDRHRAATGAPRSMTLIF